MKKIVALFIISFASTMSFANGAGLTLDEAITALKNDVDLTAVARAIVCAEEQIGCDIPTRLYMVDSLFSKPTAVITSSDVDVLERALLATELYSSEELERIEKALNELKIRFLIK